MPYPTVILPGYLAGAPDYIGLQRLLGERGYPARVVPLQVRDWIPTLGGRPVTPILDALAIAVDQVRQDFGASQVNLIGHSAGGWIARIYLGSVPYYERVWWGQPHVASLITLGSPHTSQERWTRFNLDFVTSHYPGAFHASVKYVCVAGRATLGRKMNWRSPQTWTLRQWNAAAWLAYSSYQLTSGVGATWGDGITPIEAAHLDGATNLTLENVFHSPRGQRYWYGSPAALDHWLQYLQ